MEGNRSEEWFLWCLGASMFAHLAVFFGIDYFDQMEFAWFALLAIISMPITASKRLPSTKIRQSLAPELTKVMPHMNGAFLSPDSIDREPL